MNQEIDNGVLRRFAEISTVPKEYINQLVDMNCLNPVRVKEIVAQNAIMRINDNNKTITRDQAIKVIQNLFPSISLSQINEAETQCIRHQYFCELCHRRISKEVHQKYKGHCKECYTTKNELDLTGV